MDCCTFFIFIAKCAPKKIWTLICCKKFLSPDLALYLHKSMTQPCMECCCHIWAGAPSCYLKLLDQLQKQICRTVGPSLPASLEPLGNRQNIASLSLFYRCSSKLAVKWFHFLILEGGLLILIDCMISLLPSIVLQGCLCQQFLSSHGWTLEFSANRMLSFQLWSKWL